MTKSLQNLFKLTLNSNAGEIKLTDIKQDYLVLFFYPKDSTAGCTIEAQEFSALLTQFEEANTLVLG